MLLRSKIYTQSASRRLIPPRRHHCAAAQCKHWQVWQMAAQSLFFFFRFFMLLFHWCCFGWEAFLQNGQPFCKNVSQPKQRNRSMNWHLRSEVQLSWQRAIELASSIWSSFKIGAWVQNSRSMYLSFSFYYLSFESICRYKYIYLFIYASCIYSSCKYISCIYLSIYLSIYIYI